MKRIAVCLVILAVVLACRDQRSVTSPLPNADFLDGRSQNGNHHFFFLPPLVGEPTLNGTFNPNLRPIVLICQLDVVMTSSGTVPTGCTTSGPGPISPGLVQVDLVDEQYAVNWNTGQPAIDPSKFYRIEVFGSLGGTLLGFADVDPVSNGSQLKNVQTNQFIGLVDGRTLPIKFRIERGAFCKSTADCGEATVGTGGGTVITNTGLAGALFPPGALPADVVVTIETVTERPCLPIDLLQRSGCYQFTTDPGPTLFSQQVTAGICVDVEGLTPTEISLLHLHQLDFVEETPVVTPLPNVAAHFLACDEPHPPPTVGLAKKLLGLFLPQPLFAAHLGVGGLTGSFSRIGWALPAQMSPKAGDGQTAGAGTAVAIPPSVLLKDSSGAPVAAESVKFSVGSGGGSVTGAATMTDATGVAAVTSWTLGTTSGANTLTATSRGAMGSPVTFTATVCGSLEVPAATSGWTLSTQAVNVSTVSGGEALALNPLSGAIFVKSLQDPAGFSVQLAQVNPDGSVTALTTFPDVQNSDLSGITVDPLTGGIIVADAISPGVEGRIALIGLPDLTISTLFQANWVMNPGSNGTGQEQYATDPANPNILYFWDATLSKLFRLDRATSGLQEVLALDQATAAGQHFSTFHNDIVFDQPTGKLLLTDGGSNSVLEVDPSTSPATVRTLFSGLSERPAAIAVNASTKQVFVVVAFSSILVGPRAGGSLSLVACGFPLLADIAVNGTALYAVDKELNTVYKISRSVVP